MKRIIALVAVLVLLVVILSGCTSVGNRQVGMDTTQTFTKASIPWNGEWIEVDVEYWRDFDDSDVVQIQTKDYVYLVYFMTTLRAPAPRSR